MSASLSAGVSVPPGEAAASSAPPVAGSSTTRAVAICGAYCVLSSCCILHNKFLLSSILPHANTLLLAQDVFTLTLLMIFSSRVVKNAPSPVSALYIPVTVYHSPGDWIIGLCYSFNVVAGVWCLGYLSVPMFSSIKRCNIIVVWIIEVIWSRGSSTWPTLKPLILLLGGTLLMSYYDLQFSSIGYIFGVLSCVFQSVSFELGKRLVNHGKDLWSVLLINSLVSTTVQLTYMTVAGELPILQSVIEYLLGGAGIGTLDSSSSVPLFLTMLTSGNRVDVAASLFPQKLWMHLLFNALLIAMMNYVIFLNCSVNSPLAHAVTGNVKSVVTVIAGILIFAVPMRSMAIVGIVVGFSGGAWFSWIKLQHQQNKSAAAPTVCAPDAVAPSSLNSDEELKLKSSAIGIVVK
jgi:hypothetical protein